MFIQERKKKNKDNSTHINSNSITDKLINIIIYYIIYIYIYILYIYIYIYILYI